MSELVTRLSHGEHPIEVSLRPDQTVKALKECLDRDYVLIRFTSTRGGTELGVPVDRERSNLSRANFDEEAGSLTIVGELTLDWIPVRCVVDIELPSLKGVGRLELVSASAA